MSGGKGFSISSFLVLWATAIASAQGPGVLGAQGQVVAEHTRKVRTNATGADPVDNVGESSPEFIRDMLKPLRDMLERYDPDALRAPDLLCRYGLRAWTTTSSFGPAGR